MNIHKIDVTEFSSSWEEEYPQGEGVGNIIFM